MADNFESTWLYTVTKNESLQYLKKNKFNISLDENIDAIKSENNELENVTENEDYKKIVKKLNKKQEQIISMKVLSEFTFKEIGEILSMPTATVQWYYYKSIKSLKIAISNLAMFIIAVIAGWKINDKNKTGIHSDNVYKKEQVNLGKENSESESISASESNSESVTSSSENSKVFGDETESVVSDSKFDISSSNTNTISLGIFSLAGIFLIISIIFSIIFIKHQQNDKRKSSKK